MFSEIPTFLVAGHETTRYTRLSSSSIFFNWNWQFLDHDTASRWHGRYMLWLKTRRLKRNFVKKYPIYLPIIRQWMIWTDYNIWTLSYAKLCVFTRQSILYNGRQRRMIISLLVSRSPTWRELSTMKSGELLIRFFILFYSHLSLLFYRYRIRKGQTVMVPIALINQDKSIWGEDAGEFK